jgi:DNA adenine methylase
VRHRQLLRLDRQADPRRAARAPDPEPWWRDLARTILLHDPREDVEVRGARSRLARIPAHKSLFTQDAHHGLPIGNLSSQFFANVYLDELDQFVKHRLRAPHYIRYVDDFVLLHESPRQLNAWRAAIEAFLAERLRIALNPAKTILQPIARGIDFVGQVIKPHRRTIRRRTFNEALSRLEHAAEESRSGARRTATSACCARPPTATAIARASPTSCAGEVLRSITSSRRAYSEVYNDLEGDVVNLFRVLQDLTKAADLRRRLHLTPFARDEFLSVLRAEPADEIDRAHKMLCRAFMGHGSASMTREHKTGFRANANKQGTTPAHDWANFPNHVPAIVERLRGVLIENRTAVSVICQMDTPETLFYCDPPYVFGTRSGLRLDNPDHRYLHEMTDADHRELAEVLHGVEGMVVLSGYPYPMYDEVLYVGWERFERPWIADGGRPRTEVLWLNQACSEALHRQQPRLIA